MADLEPLVRRLYLQLTSGFGRYSRSKRDSTLRAEQLLEANQEENKRLRAIGIDLASSVSSIVRIAEASLTAAVSLADAGSDPSRVYDPNPMTLHAVPLPSTTFQAFAACLEAPEPATHDIAQEGVRYIRVAEEDHVTMDDREVVSIIGVRLTRAEEYGHVNMSYVWMDLDPGIDLASLRHPPIRRNYLDNDFVPIPRAQGLRWSPHYRTFGNANPGQAVGPEIRLYRMLWEWRSYQRGDYDGSLRDAGPMGSEMDLRMG